MSTALQTRSRSAWLWAIAGMAVLSHCAYLFSVKVSHTGVILPAALGVAMCIWAWAGASIRAWFQAKAYRRTLSQLLIIGFGVWVLSLLLFFAYLQRQSSLVQSDVDAPLIIVLGSSTPNAKPSPTLEQRLLVAANHARRMASAHVIVSGGADYGQVIPEARVMADYLIAQGLNSERIWLEDKSNSTQENLAFSGEVAKSHGFAQSTPMLLVTSDFHTLRASWIAAKSGWSNVIKAGAPTPLYMRYNAWLREYFACLSGLILREF